jgi:hypothetical protein
MINLGYLTIPELKKHLKRATHPVLKNLNLLNSVRHYIKFLDLKTPLSMDQFLAVLDQVNQEPIVCHSCGLEFSFMDASCIYCYLGGEKKLIFDLHVHNQDLNPKGDNVFLLVLVGNDFIRGPLLIKNFQDIIQSNNQVRLRQLALDLNSLTQRQLSQTNDVST